MEKHGKLCVTEDNNQNTNNPNFPITTRFYDIIINATDAKGNSGLTSCTVIVVPDNEEHYPGKGKGSAKCSKKGKGKGCAPHDPNNLVEEYNISQKRFKIGTFSHMWDFSLNDDITFPPTSAPAIGKGKGSTSIKKTKKDGKSKKKGGKSKKKGKRVLHVEAANIEEDEEVIEWEVMTN